MHGGVFHDKENQKYDIRSSIGCIASNLDTICNEVFLQSLTYGSTAS